LLDEAWKTFWANKTYYCALGFAKLFYCAVYSEPVPGRFDDDLASIVASILGRIDVDKDLKYIPK